MPYALPDWREAFGEALDLVVPVVTEEPALVERVRAVAPEAVRVVQVTDLQSARNALAGSAVLSGVVLDTELVRLHWERIFQHIDTMWPMPPLAAIHRASRQIESAETHAPQATQHIFEHAPTAQVEEQLSLFLRRSLDSRLRWAARFLGFAVMRRLEGALMSTFVALVIRQVPRPELPAYLGIHEKTLQKRIGNLTRALEINGGVSRLFQYLNTVPSFRVSPPQLAGLEEAAIAHRMESARAARR